jgi:hypothetical protein
MICFEPCNLVQADAQSLVNTDCIKLLASSTSSDLPSDSQAEINIEAPSGGSEDCTADWFFLTVQAEDASRTPAQTNRNRIAKDLLQRATGGGDVHRLFQL